MIKKRIAASLVFVLGLAALLHLLSPVFLPKDNTREAGVDYPDAYGFLGEPEDTIDVVVLGDSESYSAVSPLTIWKNAGYTTYVCGTAGQPLPLSYSILEEVFRHQSPKYVFLETLEIFREITDDHLISFALSRYEPIFRYHRRWMTLRGEDFSKEPQATYRSDYLGQYPKEEIQPGPEDPYMIPSGERAPIPGLNRSYVAALDRLCKENGAQLVLFSTPSSVNWNYSLHNAVNALADKLECEYIDMNLKLDEIPIDWSRDTRDNGDHLNTFGAIKVSAFLSSYLQSGHLLTDHRGDPAYRDWDRRLSLFESLFTDV